MHVGPGVGKTGAAGFRTGQRGIEGFRAARNIHRGLAGRAFGRFRRADRPGPRTRKGALERRSRCGHGAQGLATQVGSFPPGARGSPPLDGTAQRHGPACRRRQRDVQRDHRDHPGQLRRGDQGRMERLGVRRRRRPLDEHPVEPVHHRRHGRSLLPFQLGRDALPLRSCAVRRVRAPFPARRPGYLDAVGSGYAFGIG